MESRVLERAGEQTIGNFRRTVKRAVLSLDSRDAQLQHRDALAERRVVLYPDELGMATVWAYLAADIAQQLMTTLDAHAATLDDCEQSRTADQKRADILADLADLAMAGLSTTWQGRAPSIEVSVALSTLLGLDDQPAELAGHGPIPAVLARRIAADPTGTWRRFVTDHAGRLLDCSRSYRPPAPLRDYVIARDRTCRFPGCHRRARRCHIDHRRPFAVGGTTTLDNLECLCTRHHRLKHETGWHLHRTDDAHEWTTPTGRRYHQLDERHPPDQTLEPAPF